MEPPDRRPGPPDAARSARTIFRITDLQVRYGANPVIKGVSLEADKGDVRVILGANGAGKTTILKTIMGVLKAAAGQVEFPPGRPLQGLASPADTSRVVIALQLVSPGPVRPRMIGLLLGSLIHTLPELP